jgi:hypothetical protein
VTIPCAEARENGGLIARARADLEDRLAGFRCENGRHRRDHVGLGDRLAASDRKRFIGVGEAVRILRERNDVRGDGPERFVNAFVRYSRARIGSSAIIVA